MAGKCKMEIDIPWSEICRLAEEQGYVLFPKDLLFAFAETRDRYTSSSSGDITIINGTGRAISLPNGT